MGDSMEHENEALAVAAEVQPTRVAPIEVTAANEKNNSENSSSCGDNGGKRSLEQQGDEMKEDASLELHKTREAPGLINPKQSRQIIQVRLLVRRREAGALIGKKGYNIKRLRDSFSNSNFSIPDTGNGPERIVCISSDSKTMTLILNDITGLLLEKSPQRDDQIELKLLIHSWFAGLLIGMGGQSIKKLRNDSKAAIKIFEMCCPFSNERICAIKAKPEIVVQTLAYIQKLIQDNPHKGTIKSYDALNFDLSLVDKYGGFFPEEFSSPTNNPTSSSANNLNSNSWRVSHPSQQHLAPQNDLISSALRQQPLAPHLHSILDSLYHQQQQMLRCHQTALQQQRPMKRYSVWRATTPSTSTSSQKSRQANEQQLHPHQANSIDESLVSCERQSAKRLERANQPASANRYHPYQQSVSINARHSAIINDANMCRPEMVINSVCEPISRDHNISWARMPNHQQLVQLQQHQQMQQRAALFPASITPDTQNQSLFSMCKNLSSNNNDILCQHDNSQHQQQLTHPGPNLTCLCGLFMPLDSNQVQPQLRQHHQPHQCDGLSSGSTARPSQPAKDVSINNISPVESYSDFISNQTTSAKNNMTDNQQRQQLQAHSNLPVAK